MSAVIELSEKKGEGIVWRRWKVVFNVSLTYSVSELSLLRIDEGLAGTFDATAHYEAAVVAGDEASAVEMARKSIPEDFGKPCDEKFELVKADLVVESVEADEPVGGWCVYNRDEEDCESILVFFQDPQAAVDWAVARAVSIAKNDADGTYRGAEIDDLEVLAEVSRFSAQLLLNPGRHVGFGKPWEEEHCVGSTWEWSLWFTLAPVEPGKELCF